MIPYARQNITQKDIDAVINVLKSDFLTQGSQVTLFEEKVASKVSSKYAISTNSATSALHIACLSLGLGPGDVFWTTPISFVASANCGLYCGAEVDFVDIDPHTYNICINSLEYKLKIAKKFDKLPKVLIVVHLCGQSCDMKNINKLALKYRFKVIEDASHAIGGKYDNEYIGNCKFSDITVFSFHPVKIITTAEGGLATTNCKLLSSKMKLLRSHGITRDKNQMLGKSDGPWYYQQIELGFNYRMNEIQAALGISQMDRLDEFVKHRNKLSDRYDMLLENLPIKKPFQYPKCYSSRHLYIIRLQLDKITKSRHEVFNSMQKNGIGVNLHYIPIHTQPYFQKFGFNSRNFPESEKYYNEAITLPLFFDMNKNIQDEVVFKLRKILK